MSIVTVGRWGNSLAIRIPGDIAACAGLRDGEPVEVEAATTEDEADDATEEDGN